MGERLPKMKANSDEADEAREIIRAHREGRLKNVPDAKAEIRRYASYAKAANRRDRSVSLRMNSRDLLALQARASQAGLPYQTLINALIHKYVQGEVELKI